MALAAGWPATVAVALIASAPVVRALVRALGDGWQPVADRAIIATRAYDVLSTHMPLVGQYSFASEVTGHPTYSLGPMLYWLLAPAAHIGSPGSLIVTMAALNAASIAAAVALARRRGGVGLMLATGAAIALMCRSLTAADFYDIWNPAAALFPLLALAFVCWSLGCGEHRLAPAAALLGSYCAQCHDAFAMLAAALLLAGTAGLALSRTRPFAATRSSRTWPWLAAAALVLAACWTAPVLDQVAGSGNLGHLLQTVGSGRPRLGWGVGAHAVARTVGAPPWWLTTVSSPWSRKLEVHGALGTGTFLTAALLVGWLLAAAAAGLARRRLDVAAGCACALGLCLAVGLITAWTPTGRILGGTLGYTLWSASIAGVFAWLVAGWSAIVLLAPLARSAGLPHRPALGAPALAAGAACLLVAGWYGAAREQRDEHRFEFAAVKRLDAGLAAVPRGSVVNLTARLDGVITPLRPELTYALRTRGVRALGTGAYLRLGHWYERGGRRTDYVLRIYDRGRPQGRVIATASLRVHGRVYRVGLLLAPATPARRAASSRPGRA